MTVRTRTGVVVVGSVNHDIVTEVERLPGPGETVLATASRSNLGGKGSNQAVAAARSGVGVALVGRLGGRDPRANAIAAELAAAGVDVAGLRAAAGRDTGTAYITVSPTDNQIVVVPGANLDWDPAPGADAAARDAAAVVVGQLEIPLDVVRWAAEGPGRFVLNAAPALPLDDALLSRCDPLVVNEHELGIVSGLPVEGLGAAAEAQRRLCRRGTPSVVTTLGSAGALWCVGSDGSQGHQPAPEVRVVDSTGAGDAFVGQLAASLAGGAGVAEAVRWATAAGSLSVQTRGTHASYPSRDQVAAVVDGLPPARTIRA